VSETALIKLRSGRVRAPVVRQALTRFGPCEKLGLDECWVWARGLLSFPFQLNLSSSVHRVSQPHSRMYPGVAQVEL